MGQLVQTLKERGHRLTPQRQLIFDASLSPDRIVCVVCVAGAGKTTALRVLAEANRENGVPVLGAASHRTRTLERRCGPELSL